MAQNKTKEDVVNFIYNLAVKNNLPVTLEEIQNGTHLFTDEFGTFWKFWQNEYPFYGVVLKA